MDTFRRLVAVPMVTIALLASTATAAAAPAAAPAAASSEGRQIEREAVQAALDDAVAAGVTGVIAEVRDKHGRWRGSSGRANVHREGAPRTDGRFRVGSVTKTFVATTVLQLVEEGAIGLDSPVEDYLPGVIPGNQGITVRELMQHTSGLYNYTLDLIPGDSAEEVRHNIRELRFEAYQPQELVDIAMRHEPQYQPPEDGRWYSNTNYILLGMIIARVTGNEPADEIRQRIIRPLGMRHTSMPEWNPLILGPNARGYEEFPDTRPLDVTVFSPSWARTAGSIISTTAELNRFYRALLTGELVSPELLRQMKATTRLPEGINYGLGLMSLPGCGGKIWGHTGGVPGFSTFSFSTPDGQTQVTMSANEGLTSSATREAAQALNNVLVTTFCPPSSARIGDPGHQNEPAVPIVDLARSPELAP